MLIGIIGKKRHGKDSIADILVDHFNFTKYSFAEPLKEACRIIFNLNDDQLCGDKKEEIDNRWGLSARQLLQFVGTELFRVKLPELSTEFNNIIGNNIWVKLFEYSYDKTQHIVIPDCRFMNEIEAIKNLNGIILRVIRNLPETNDSHSSELEWLSYNPDYIIENNSSLEELEDKVIDFMVVKKENE